MLQENYSIEVLPISDSEEACICAIKGDVVYEHPHGAYQNSAEAESFAADVSADTNEIESTWQLISC